MKEVVDFELKSIMKKRRKSACDTCCEVEHHKRKQEEIEYRIKNSIPTDIEIHKNLFSSKTKNHDDNYHYMLLNRVIVPIKIAFLNKKHKSNQINNNRKQIIENKKSSNPSTIDNNDNDKNIELQNTNNKMLPSKIDLNKKLDNLTKLEKFQQSKKQLLILEVHNQYDMKIPDTLSPTSVLEPIRPSPSTFSHNRHHPYLSNTNTTATTTEHNLEFTSYIENFSTLNKNRDEWVQYVSTHHDKYVDKDMIHNSIVKNGDFYIDDGWIDTSAFIFSS